MRHCGIQPHDVLLAFMNSRGCFCSIRLGHHYVLMCMLMQLGRKMKNKQEENVN